MQVLRTSLTEQNNITRKILWPSMRMLNMYVKYISSHYTGQRPYKSTSIKKKICYH